MSVPSSDGGFSAALISVRIVDIDYYLMSLDKYSPAVAFQAARLSLPSSHSIPKLPTIRIFGCTPAGQKACLHLHGARPYFYVPLPEAVPLSRVASFCAELQASLESALAASFSCSDDPASAIENGSGARPATAFIAEIEPVQKSDIYGYRSGPSMFLKISTYNPRNVARLAAILWAGGGLPREYSGSSFQPYESHIPFTMQVLTDLSLVGMGYINLSSCRFRLPLPSHAAASEVTFSDFSSSSPVQRIFTEEVRNRRPDLLWPFQTARQTRCDIELDAFVGDVLNPVESSQPHIYAQKRGPEYYAVKTLRTIWEEERLRTGRRPALHVESPRSVVAGHGLSDSCLSSKLLSLLSNEDPSPSEAAAQTDNFVDGKYLNISASRESQNGPTFADVIAFLDSSEPDPLTSTRQFEANQQDDMESSGDDLSEADAAKLSDDEWDDWDAIQESTQACLLKIPQGDGESPGHSGQKQYQEKSNHRRQRPVSESQTRARRQKRFGEYKKLQVKSEEQSNASPTSNSVKDNLFPSIHLGRGSQHSSSRSEDIFDDERDGGTRPHSGVDPRASALEELIPERFQARRAAHCEQSHGSQSIAAAHGDRFPDTISSVPARNSGGCGSLRADSARTGSDGGSTHPAVNLYQHAFADERKAVGSVVPRQSAPSSREVVQDLANENIPRVRHVNAFYSLASDLNDKSREYGGTGRRVRGNRVEDLEHVENAFGGVELMCDGLHFGIVTTVRSAPSTRAVMADLSWFESDDQRRSCRPSMKAAHVMDSAGRFVGLDATSYPDNEGVTQSSVLSAMGYSPARQRFTRRAERCFAGDNDSSSDDSVDDKCTLSSADRSASEQLHSQLNEFVDRPLSPKYDEQYIFTETPRKSRMSLRNQADFESPVLYRGSRAQKKNLDSPHSRSGSCSSHRLLPSKNISLAVIEIIATSHSQRLSDPRIDAVLAICIAARDDRIAVEQRRESVSVFVQGVGPCKSLAQDMGVQHFGSEEELLEAAGTFIRDFDPDFLCGFETQMSSLGFLLDRAEHLKHQFASVISRVTEKADEMQFGRDKAVSDHGVVNNPGAEYFRRKGADMKVPGRHVLNLWRIVRKEVKLRSYSMAGVAREVLNAALPVHSACQLEEWMRSETRVLRAITYLKDQASVDLALIDKLDIVSRTSEFASVYGIDFMSVLTRGSQYRVESMLARVAHARGFILLAAQRDQVFDQPAVECLPLVMEPASAFYVDPVIVLDFQSLYPSMIIAHNLCFSTMLGNLNRISAWTDVQQLGVVREYRAPDASNFHSNEQLKRPEIYVAPNGEMFVTSNVRRGLLPQMLQEILETRVMVKSSMKQLSREEEDLLKQHNSRQFGLKLIANVTYGYAAASFSGRMPCAGLADSIVQCGREALERIVNYVDGDLNAVCGSRVVYGDTDSLFVQIPGGSKADAFSIGRRICEEAASLFPAPVTLQLEKVYHPCILVTKKRYVGYAYESEDNLTPTFDAKGIETVRRDSCGVVQKTMENALRVLFESKDVSRVKRLVQRTMLRILSNRHPLPDFIFRKEVRMGTYKDILPPAAVVASRLMEQDPRAAPRHGERVPFVVVFGGVGAALKDCVLSPNEMLELESRGFVRLHSTYYITKQIVPALDRMFSLLGVKVFSWYAELPRTSFDPIGVAHAGRIQLYFPKSRPCVVCRGISVGTSVCKVCRLGVDDKQASYFLLAERQRHIEQKLTRLTVGCLTCIGRHERDPSQILCRTLDCVIRFERHRTILTANQGRAALGDIEMWT